MYLKIVLRIVESKGLAFFLRRMAYNYILAIHSNDQLSPLFLILFPVIERPQPDGNFDGRILHHFLWFLTENSENDWFLQIVVAYLVPSTYLLTFLHDSREGCRIVCRSSNVFAYIDFGNHVVRQLLIRYFDSFNLITMTLDHFLQNSYPLDSFDISCVTNILKFQYIFT